MCKTIVRAKKETIGRVRVSLDCTEDDFDSGLNVEIIEISMFILSGIEVGV